MAYYTLPVRVMARIAATEEVDGIRDEEDISSTERNKPHRVAKVMHTCEAPRTLCRIIKWRRIRLKPTCQN